MPRLTDRHAVAYSVMTGNVLCALDMGDPAARREINTLDAARILRADSGAVFCDSTPEGDTKLATVTLAETNRALRHCKGWGVVGDVLTAAADRVAQRSTL